MSYTVECMPAEDHLRICITGAWPSKKPDDIMADIHALWTEHQSKPLLIDMRNMEDNPAVLSDYENAKRFEKAGYRRIGRIAVLDREDRCEANDFFETTALNRGLGFRFFYGDEQEAISWILTKERNKT